MHHSSDFFYLDTLKYKMGNPIAILSTHSMGKSIRMKRVSSALLLKESKIPVYLAYAHRDIFPTNSLKLKKKVS